VRDTFDDKRAPDVVPAVLKHGSLARGEAYFVLKTSERTARNTLNDLVKQGFLKSDSPKAPFERRFRSTTGNACSRTRKINVPEPLAAAPPLSKAHKPISVMKRFATEPFSQVRRIFPRTADMPRVVVAG